MRLPDGTEIGKYVLLHREGGGSFGNVYKAEDRATNSVCALKCIEVDPTTGVPLVLQEAKNLKACQSQHIVGISSADVHVIAGQYVVVIDMEYLPEGSLERRIETVGISYEEALCANRHLLTGLSAAHANGIIHKDVKPANLMISGHIYKLSDFGISYVKATAVGMALTYEPNAAPEILNGQVPDERSDVYAAGVTLYRSIFLSGPTSIDHGTLDGWEKAGRKTGLPAFAGIPAHCPSRLKSVILKATDADPAKRYGSVDEMLSALERLKVEMPWKKDAGLSWEARQGARIHRMSVRKIGTSWELCCTLNGRRRNADCAVFATEKQAEKAMLARVAKTTLAKAA